MLGLREPDVYGTTTLDGIESNMRTLAAQLGVEVEFFQSNDEGKLIDRIQQAYGQFDGIIINPAAFTHYSYAISDALRAVAIPAVEVHMSNIYQREPFRHYSVTAPVVVGQICGFGALSYELGLHAIHQYFIQEKADDE